MGLAAEFKEFAMKGNVVDMAVGVIIGAAFGKIVSSLVANVVMPPLGLAIGGVNFSDLAVELGPNAETGEPVLLNYGLFLQAAFDFFIIALVLFLAIRALNKLKKPPPAAAPAAPPRQEVLLQEIRDLLAKQQH
ncbi:MAG: large-conductance mechanosensitive channel protein MscL [Gammaproteobacteria bacterium]|nr:large-conductance mechanosensitive channel protein MscL [Gammaproteobacteria bacterium]